MVQALQLEEYYTKQQELKRKGLSAINNVHRIANFCVSQGWADDPSIWKRSLAAVNGLQERDVDVVVAQNVKGGEDSPRPMVMIGLSDSGLGFINKYVGTNLLVEPDAISYADKADSFCVYKDSAFASMRHRDEIGSGDSFFVEGDDGCMRLYVVVDAPMEFVNAVEKYEMRYATDRSDV